MKFRCITDTFLLILFVTILGTFTFADAASDNSQPLVLPVLTPTVTLPVQQSLERPHRTEKPIFFYRNASISEDQVWRGEVLVEGSLTIAPQATLTIEPGTVVRFQRLEAGSSDGTSLVVQGRLFARGTTDKPILFTSNFSEAAKGDWYGVILLASEKKNILEECQIEGAHTGLRVLFSTVTMKNSSFTSCGTGADFLDSYAVINGGTITKCSIGMAVYDSEADLRGVTFSKNQTAFKGDGISLYLDGIIMNDNLTEGLHVENSKVKLVSSSISANGTGLMLVGCEGGVSACKIADNLGFGLAIAKSRIRISGNEIIGNGTAGIFTDGGRSVAWGNVISSNRGHEIYNRGSDDFIAIGNWWGEGDLSDPDKRLYDRRLDQNSGRIHYAPVLSVRPRI